MRKLYRASGRGLISEPAERLQGNKDRQRAGQFAHEIFDAVVDPLAAAARPQFVPLDHIRENGIRQNMRGRDTDACHDSQHQDVRDLSRLNGIDQQLHDGPKRHADDVGALLAKFARQPDPKRQDNDRSYQQAGKDG